ncbi:MAG: hypothetical protein RLZZ491_1179 [Pseudomonadota bacterium]
MPAHNIILGANSPSGPTIPPAVPVFGLFACATPRKRNSLPLAKGGIRHKAPLPHDLTMQPFGGGVPVGPCVGYLAAANAPGPNMQTVQFPESD